MTEFVLIDLHSQADAFARFSRGWPVADVLKNIQRYGVVRYYPEVNAYVFQSHVGIAGGFRFTEDGRLVILYDHSTYVPGQESTSA